MSNTRYILLTSRSRDRVRWPNPAEFEVELSMSGRNNDGLAARDPVLSAYPLYTWTGSAPGPGGYTDTFALNSGVPSAPVLEPTTASTINDYYTGLILQDTTIAESARITGYDGSSFVATPQATFGTTWASTDTYVIINTSTSSEVVVQGGSSIDQFYTGMILEDVTIGEFRTITNYDATTRVATLESAFGGGWAATDTYNIRGAVPRFVGPAGGTGVTGGTISTVTFPAAVGTADYTGFYVYMTSGAASGDVRRIRSYDTATRVATVGPNFSGVPVATDGFEILTFSYDNYVPMTFSGSQLSNQNAACWEITLVSLTLPNATLATGGRSVVYPYFLVEFSNRGDSSAGSRDLLYTNNPDATRAVFQAVTSDTSSVSSTKFIKLDSSGATQTIKFKPNDTLYVRIFTPYGDLFQTTTIDNMSPLPPNPLLQISAFFAIRKVS